MRVALVLVLLGAQLPAVARADDASEARFFDQLARRAFDHGDYRTALEDFLLAYTAAESSALAFNIAVCADLVGESRMAFTYFQRFLDDAEAPAERRARAVAALERLRPRLRVVTVRSEPPGATVYLDTEERGTFGRTPLEVALEPDQAHVLVLHLDGHLDAREPVAAAVTSGGAIVVRLVPRAGQVFVDVRPEDATVSVLRGEELVAEREGDGPFELPVGRYRLRVAGAGHVTSDRLITVTEDTEQAVSVELTPIGERTALLLLTSGEEPAIVTLDGRPVGRTPLRLPGVGPGEHAVEVRADDGRVWRGRVELREGEARLLRVGFEDQNGRRQERPRAP
ncbi:MAG: PEGA domain-containing protein [Myxococcales bacterium]|nr:PEGA domain-containing protein [Myxococcales bacterium]